MVLPPHISHSNHRKDSIFKSPMHQLRLSMYADGYSPDIYKSVPYMTRLAWLLPFHEISADLLTGVTSGQVGSVDWLIARWRTASEAYWQYQLTASITGQPGKLINFQIPEDHISYAVDSNKENKIKPIQGVLALYLNQSILGLSSYKLELITILIWVAASEIFHVSAYV